MGGRSSAIIAHVLNRLNVPGTVRDTYITDPLTGQNLEVRVGRLFMRISVDGRDYYFRRRARGCEATGAGSP